MKYIRTKDTIFEVVEETDLVYRVKAKGNPNNIYSKSKINTMVVASDDHLYNLCDRFVIASHNSTYYEITDDLEYAEYFVDCEYETKIYGAIFTNKGLIYVAENKGGKWVLL